MQWPRHLVKSDLRHCEDLLHPLALGMICSTTFTKWLFMLLATSVGRTNHKSDASPFSYLTLTIRKLITGGEPPSQNCRYMVLAIV
jgi:hypothetical protein